jgi:type II secretory pathway component PulJ
MKRMNSNRARNKNRATLGMTLVELMIAVAVGFLLLAVVAVVFRDGIKSFALMGNYVSMDRDSRNTLDQMTREIRRAGSLTSFTTDRLVFTKYGATNVTLIYQWDSGTQQLTEWKTGNAKTNILLSECDEFAFAIQKASGAATTSTAEAKKISVAWKCSRQILGKKLSTEQMQQALIVVRNKMS